MKGNFETLGGELRDPLSGFDALVRCSGVGLTGLEPIRDVHNLRAGTGGSAYAFNEARISKTRYNPADG